MTERITTKLKSLFLLEHRDVSGVFLRPPSALQHHILCIICCGSDSAPKCVRAGRQHTGTVEHVALQTDCLDLNIDSPAPADCVTLNPQVLQIPFCQVEHQNLYFPAWWLWELNENLKSTQKMGYRFSVWNEDSLRRQWLKEIRNHGWDRKNELIQLV